MGSRKNSSSSFLTAADLTKKSEATLDRISKIAKSMPTASMSSKPTSPPKGVKPLSKLGSIKQAIFGKGPKEAHSASGKKAHPEGGKASAHNKSAAKGEKHEKGGKAAEAKAHSHPKAHSHDRDAGKKETAKKGSHKDSSHKEKGHHGPSHETSHSAKAGGAHKGKAGKSHESHSHHSSTEAAAQTHRSHAEVKGQTKKGAHAGQASKGHGKGDGKGSDKPGSELHLKSGGKGASAKATSARGGHSYGSGGRGSLDSIESVCREVACEGLATTAGYCRLHYIKNWKKIKRKEIILKEGKLNQYIEELVAKYPDKYIEAIRQDLASDKDFAKVIHDLDLDEAMDDFDVEGEGSDTIIDSIKRDFDDEGDTGF